MARLHAILLLAHYCICWLRRLLMFEGPLSFASA